MIRSKSFYTRFLKMFLLLVLGNVLTLSVNLADNIMLGSFSETSLAGAAAVNQIQFVYQSLLSAFAEGVVILGSQFFGAGQTAPKKRSPPTPSGWGFTSPLSCSRSQACSRAGCCAALRRMRQ